MKTVCAKCRTRAVAPDRSVCYDCYPRELESASDKLSSAWLLLDDIARSQRDSDETRMAAARMLMSQQCPGWNGKTCSIQLWNDKQPSPRTCVTCGRGPCLLGLTRKEFPV